MRSAYHDGATDDHGVFIGSAADLCARVVRSHRRYEATMHCVLNHAIDLVDDRHATGEVYNVTYLLRAADGGRQLDTWWGRYLDRYECRDGRWAIVHRVCVHEWTRTEPLGAAMPIEAQLFRQGREDRGMMEYANMTTSNFLRRDWPGGCQRGCRGSGPRPAGC